MSQTDIPTTFLSPNDLLGQTKRTRLIPVEIPELADDDGNPGIVHLSPPPAIVQERFLASAKNREVVSKIKAAQTDEDYAELETADNFRTMGELVLQCTVNPDGERMFPKDMTVEDLMEQMQVRVFMRLVEGLASTMSDEAEEGKKLGKKSRKAKASGGRTKSQGKEESKSGS